MQGAEVPLPASIVERTCYQDGSGGEAAPPEGQGLFIFVPLALPRYLTHGSSWERWQMMGESQGQAVSPSAGKSQSRGARGILARRKHSERSLSFMKSHRRKGKQLSFHSLNRKTCPFFSLMPKQIIQCCLSCPAMWISQLDVGWSLADWTVCSVLEGGHTQPSSPSPRIWPVAPATPTPSVEGGGRQGMAAPDHQYRHVCLHPCHPSPQRWLCAERLWVFLGPGKFITRGPENSLRRFCWKSVENK